jgi:hypothetical protein
MQDKDEKKRKRKSRRWTLEQKIKSIGSTDGVKNPKSQISQKKSIKKIMFFSK